MFNIDELVIEKIQSYEFWADVPHYEKLDIIHCLSYGSIKQYLKRRKEHNKKYKEFWSNADKVTFNADKSMYRAALMTKLADK